MTQQSKDIILTGGLDLVTPHVEMNAGRMIGGFNHEATDRGYRRIDGYERFDGNPEPSKAFYYAIPFHNGVTDFVVGETVTCAGGTGAVLQLPTLTSGSFGGGDAAGVLVLVLTADIGNFAAGLSINSGKTTRATCNGAPVFNGSTTDAEFRQRIEAAIEYTRALIGHIPGSGPIRGVVMYKGAVYAFRDNADGTRCDLWKSSSPTGWLSLTNPNISRKLAFTSGGAHVLAPGQTITGATSGITGVVGKIRLTSGSFAGGDAAGFMWINSQSGAFLAENLNVGADLNVATIAGDTDAAVVLLPGGRYDFDIYNFGGAAGTEKLYGADGVNKAFEWDGTTFAQITTGVADDTPDYVACDHLQIFLGFKEGAVDHSGFPGGVADPFDFDPANDAGEIAVGHTLTGIFPRIAGTVIFMCVDAVIVLYGTGEADFKADPLNEGAGGFAWTGQSISTLLYLDNSGVRTLSTTQAYGNFKVGTLTAAIYPLLKTKREAGVRVTASLKCRTKAQYRMFFDDGTGVTLYVESKVAQPSRFTLPVVVRCCCSSTDPNGDEQMFFGSDDGYVYQLDAGTSFDGAPIPASARMAFANMGASSVEKRWHKAVLETDANQNIALSLIAEFAYGAPTQPAAELLSFTVTGGGGFWGDAIWGEFIWSAAVSGLAECYIDGLGQNCSVYVASALTYEAPYTLSVLRLYYSNRKLIR